MSLKQCVVGFMFCKPQVHCDAHVVLIKKHKPDWQRGKLNGVGGKLEEKELPRPCMVREFKEETGLETTEADWKLFCILDCEPHETRLFFYKSFVTQVLKVEPYLNPPEEVSWHSIPKVLNLENGLIIPNLRWLIPMALYANELQIPTLSEKVPI